MSMMGTKRIYKAITILRKDSNFAEFESNYASHNFHAFAAKFPPQLPRIFIENLTEEDEIVLDPMVGSGTAVVEAILMGRQAIGFDIDPLAVHLSKIKTSKLNYERIEANLNKLLAGAVSELARQQNIDDRLNQRFDLPTRKFIDYWFKKSTQKELLALITAIEALDDNEVRDFFKLVFSSIIITKSGGVTLARDLAHTRPHKVIEKIPKNALEVFAARARKLLNSHASISLDGMDIRIEQADAKGLPLENETVDLIITSPPYANAIDYMRAHKFSLVWFGKPISELSELRSKYIGSERISSMSHEQLPRYCENSIRKVESLDKKKAMILRKYFIEMKLALNEMKRVLKRGKYLILVVGNSTMRGHEVKTNINLEEIGKMLGFTIHDQIIRQIDRGRRMMPTSFNTDRKGIEHRMHEEYILIFEKR